MGGRTIPALTGLALLACWPATAQEERRCAEAEAAASIVERRQAWGAAIRDADLPAIEAVLAPDVVLVTGTDSDLFQGREAQLAIWHEDFEKPDDRMVYVRTPECVERSDLAPIALEHGHWRGEGLAGAFAAGRYAAKWRRDGEWRLEAEVFMTTEIRRRANGRDWELRLEPPVNGVVPIGRIRLAALWAAFGEGAP